MAGGGGLSPEGLLFRWPFFFLAPLRTDAGSNKFSPLDV